MSGSPYGVSTRTANIEGYVALGVMVAYFTFPFWYPVPDHPGLIENSIGVSLWALWLLFAVSGARHARGRARVGAVVALVAFGILALLIVIVSLLRIVVA